MITNLTTLPVGFNPNYMLCIMWVDTNYSVHRYAMWKDVGELLFFDVSLYAGQKIGKNFRFEVWSIDGTPAVQSDALQFVTSVLGGQDYRWAGNSQLQAADTIVTDFEDDATPFSQIVVSGAGHPTDAFVNQTYNVAATSDGTFYLNGKLFYLSADHIYCIGWIDNQWQITTYPDMSQASYYSNDDVVTPNLGTWLSVDSHLDPPPAVGTTGIANQLTYTFPLTFPTNSVPQLNQV